MHTTLYRKWRPDTFSSVVGQDAITDILRYEVQNGKTTHAYLFCGSRGTGKTSCAKILAKAVNCLHPVDGNPCGECEACRAVESGTCTDIIEMDAASNTGVDYIRDIRDDVQYAPSVLKKKVYIIDEVHMLSQSAFNALLKTLEEPPEHIVFIFATTEFHKLPVTIVSRCQRFDFKRIPVGDIISRLSFIAENEKIEITEDAVKQIALLAKGGMRDAISLFELCAATGKKIDGQVVTYTLGVPDRRKLSALVSCVVGKNIAGLFRGVNSFVQTSPDVSVFWQELIDFYRDMLVVTVSDTAAELLEITGEEYAETKKTASLYTKERLIYHMSLLEKAYSDMQRSPLIRRSIAEMTLVKMSDDSLCDSNEALLARISSLERKLSEGYSFEPTKERVQIPDSDAFADAPSIETKEPKTVIDNKSEPIKKQEEIFDYWAEAVLNVSEVNPTAGSFLKQTTAYFNGEKLIIRSTPFIKTMLESEKNVLTEIAAAVRETGGFDGCSDKHIEFAEIIPEKKSDFLDGLLN